MSLLPVEKALAQIVKGLKPLEAENVPLSNAQGRVLSNSLRAKRKQPPFAASAMDGYAVRALDVAKTPVMLNVVGEAPAGNAYEGRVHAGQAVRIFTGAPLPKGTDSVVIQENTEQPEAGVVKILKNAKVGEFVRPAGLDFKKGDKLLPRFTVLGAREINLAASMNYARVDVTKRPSVAILATGDELVEPGSNPRSDQIVSSNSLALAAMVTQFGGDPVDLGVVPDRPSRIEEAIARANGTDILVTLGGASVGDHDLVHETLVAAGVEMKFWKIAMRPGKPLMFGRKKAQRVLGLPGNPVSAMVCAFLFLRPLVATMTGAKLTSNPVAARLGGKLKANDQRQDYLRARLDYTDDGQRIATAFDRQDSSMQRMFREAGCLIVRPPHAPAAAKDDLVQILILDV